MRLDQFLQKTLGISRLEAKKNLKNKQVMINGNCVKQAKYKLDLSLDRVFYSEEELVYQKSFYYMLHKPKGYVSSHVHDGGMPLYSLVDEPFALNLHCAGRLDVDTTGLVLLTNDGQWSHRVTHPRHEQFKCYIVALDRPITQEMIQKLENGIILTGEKNPTQPANVEVLESQKIILEISEGKFHQVKRMLQMVGNQVIDLHREQIGHVLLGSLPEGSYRALTSSEIEGF